MRKRKKILSILLSMAMAGSLLVGCGSKGDSSSGDSSDDAAPAGTGSIVVWCEPSTYDWFEEVAAAWEDETGNTVELTAIALEDGDYQNAIDGSAGIGPDILAGPHNDVGDKSTNGTYSPIELTDETKALLNEDALAAVTFNGEIYIAPLYMGTPLLIYNKDLVPEVPETWEELLEIINDPQFDNNGDGSLGFLANLANFYYSAGFIFAGGGYMFGDDNTNVEDIGFNNEGAVYGAEYVQKLFGLMPQGMSDSATAYDVMLGLFGEGKAGIILCGTEAIATAEENGINYGVAKMFTLDNGNVVANYSGFTGMALNGYANNPELATEFINYALQDQFAASFVEKTGLVTCNQAYLDANSDSNETIKALNDQIQYSVPMVKIIEANQHWDPMHSAMAALAAGTDPQEALDAAVKQFKDNIAALDE